MHTQNKDQSSARRRVIAELHEDLGDMSTNMCFSAMTHQI